MPKLDYSDRRELLRVAVMDLPRRLRRSKLPGANRVAASVFGLSQDRALLEAAAYKFGPAHRRVCVGSVDAAESHSAPLFWGVRIAVLTACQPGHGLHFLPLPEPPTALGPACGLFALSGPEGDPKALATGWQLVSEAPIDASSPFLVHSFWMPPLGTGAARSAALQLANLLQRPAHLYQRGEYFGVELPKAPELPAVVTPEQRELWGDP